MDNLDSAESLESPNYHILLQEHSKAYSDAYRAITKCEVGAGHSILFWSDLWLIEKLEDKFPRLYSFALDKLQSISQFVLAADWITAFYLPLSAEAFAEFEQLKVLLQGLVLQSATNDKWISTIGKGDLKPSTVYKQNFRHIDTHAPSCWIWRSKCQSKHKFFAWLLLHDRLNTRDMLLRRKWNVTDNYECVLCPAHQHEDWRHLFFNCQFSTRVWNYLQIPWIPGNSSETLLAAKRDFDGPCFTEIVILACWGIWKQRNGWIFKNIRPTFRGWKAIFFHEVTRLKYRVKSSAAASLSSWLDTLS